MSKKKRDAGRKSRAGQPETKGGGGAAAVKADGNNENMLRGVVLLGWVAAMVWLLGGKRYTAFIRPDFWPMLAGALVMFLLFLWAVSFGRSGGHSHGGGGVKLMGAAAMLFLPLAYLPLGQRSTLGTYALDKREVSVAAPMTGNKVAAAVEAPASQPAGGEAAGEAKAASLIELLTKPDDYAGRRVVAEGMIHHSEDLPEGQLVLYRFVVVCCAADARPAAVVMSGSVPTGLKDDEWVRVTGAVQKGQVKGEDAVGLVAEKVERIDPPESAYIYWTP